MLRDAVPHEIRNCLRDAVYRFFRHCGIKQSGRFEQSGTVLLPVDEEFRVQGISVTIQVSAFDTLCRNFLLVGCEFADRKSFYGTDCHSQLCVVRNITPATEMGLNPSYVNILNYYMPVTAYIRSFDSVPASAPFVAAIIHSVTEHRERTLRRFYIGHISVLEFTLDAIGKSIGYTADLLPKNKIQIGFLIDIREGAVYILVFVDMLNNNIGYFRNAVYIQLLQFPDFIFVKYNTVCDIPSRIGFAKHSVRYATDRFEI